MSEAEQSRDIQDVNDDGQGGYNIYVDPSGSTGTPDLLSALLAIAHVDQGCDIHEHCNGLCTADQTTEAATKFQPNHARHSVVTYRPGTAAAQVPVMRSVHDETWLQDQKLPHFEYRSLASDAGYTRLLQVKPAIYRADVLECEVIDADLSTAPAFEALSYCWGSPVFDHPVICNGSIFHITKSLHMALKRFRQCRPDDRLEYIWVDALCVNQTDQLERTHQVMQMGRIYSTAERVRVDLGDTDTDWFEGFNLLHSLNFASERDTSSGQSDAGSSVLGLPPLNHIAWPRYMELFASPWFERTWIIQEIALAKERQVFFGRFAFDWATFMKSLRVVETNFPYMLQCNGTQSTIGYLNSVKMRQLIAWHSRPRSFLATIYPLIIAKDFIATDPRDKVIGLLGLIDEKDHKYKDGLLPAFQPDYTISNELFFQRHTTHLVDLLLGTAVLNFAGLHRRQALALTAPSWVVDWTAQSRLYLTSHYSTIRPTAYFAGGYADHFKATLASPGPDKEADVMLTTATCFDSIRAISSTLNMRSPDGTFLNDLEQYRRALSWYDEVRGKIICENDSDQKFLGATYGPAWENTLALTLLAGDTYEGDNAVTASEPIINPLATMHAAIAHMRNVVLADGALDNTTVNPYKDFSDRLITTFVTQFVTACRQRKFAFTESGKFALVPECAEVDDEVCLIVGCTIAFCVGGESANERLGRSKMPGRALLGDAYVHGCMEGEMVKMEEFETGKRRLMLG